MRTMATMATGSEISNKMPSRGFINAASQLPHLCAAWRTKLPPTQGAHRSKRRAAGAFFMRASESKTYYKVDIVSNTK